MVIFFLMLLRIRETILMAKKHLNFSSLVQYEILARDAEKKKNLEMLMLFFAIFKLHLEFLEVDPNLMNFI